MSESSGSLYSFYESSKSSSSDEIVNQCYICLGNGQREPLVSPCTQCNALAHQPCINEQVRQGIVDCGACKQELQYETTTKFKCHCDCCTIDNFKMCIPTKKEVLIGLYNFLQIVGYSLLVFGTSIVTFHIGILIIFLIITMIMMGFPIIHINTIIYKKSKHDDENGNPWTRFKYLTAHLLANLMIGLSVMFVHCIGYFFGLLFEESPGFFTGLSFIGGLSIVLGVIALGMCIGALYTCTRNIYYNCCTTQEVNVECREAEV